MKRLFGTDGIRAVAGKAPLDRPTVRRFGAALAKVLSGSGSGPLRIVLGRDTRESGPWLRDEVAAGLATEGAVAVDAGVTTTPGLSHIVAAGNFEAGVMISASHNPFEDNGLKVFAADGTKLPDALEREIEDRMLDAGQATPPEGGRAADDPSLIREYVKYLEASFPATESLAGLRLLLDCANGSASAVGPEVFAFHGAKVDTLGAAPDGRNINLGCGSLHLEQLATAVVAGGYDLGIAFDGDADRALAVARNGRTIDGDFILYLAARRMKRLGTLRNDCVVATVMSNLWLELALRAEGITLLRAAVGDKYVYERMVAEGASLGGEQSGHVIFLDHARTGDGILTGLRLLDCVLNEDRPLEAILDAITPFPQILLNVRVRAKPDLLAHPVVGPAVLRVEDAMRGRGRVLLRYSGTESLARVMVEGENEALVRSLASELAEVLRAELGA